MPDRRLAVRADGPVLAGPVRRGGPRCRSVVDGWWLVVGRSGAPAVVMTAPGVLASYQQPAIHFAGHRASATSIDILPDPLLVLSHLVGRTHDCGARCDDALLSALRRRRRRGVSVGQERGTVLALPTVGNRRFDGR